MQRILRALIIALFALCFWRRMAAQPVADEIDFILPIEKWVSEGPQLFGLWHSPFYPWLEMGVGKLIGFSFGAFRAIGFATSSLSAALMYRAAAHVNPKISESRKTMVLAFGLLAPVALGSSLLLDYDTTVLVLSTSFFLYLLARYGSEQQVSGKKLVLAFGGALGLCLIAKETTPLVYPLSFAVAFHKRFGWGRAFAGAILVGMLGCAIFLSASALWCSFYDLPFSAVFAMDLLGLKNHGSVSSPGLTSQLAARLWIKVFPVFWLSLPLSVLFLVRIPKLLRENSAIAGVATCVLSVVFAYTFGLRQVTYHFPKYMAPVLIWIPWLLIVAEKNAPSKVAPWAAGVFLWCAAIPDPFAVLYKRDAAALLTILPLTAAPYLVWFASIKKKGAMKPTIHQFTLFMALGFSLAYCRTAIFSSAEITYWYGERALHEARHATERWRRRFPTGVIYAPSKDIAYLLRDLGAQYVQKDALEDQRKPICARIESKEPILLVTRIREDSSLLHSPALAEYRQCIKNISRGVDIVLGSSYGL